MQIDCSILDELEKEFGSKKEPDIEEGAMSRFTPLYNKAEPAVELKREKPAHRLIAVLKATGLDNTEIAEMTGYSSVAVGYIVNQKHVQDIILGRIHGSGDAAMAKLQAASEAAADRLIKLSEEAKNEECRRKANNDVLDRKYGKPNQPYTVATKPVDQMADAELAKIAQGN